MSKREVWIVADNIVSPLGTTTQENYQSIKAGKTGISPIDDAAFYKEKLPAAWLDESKMQSLATPQQTRFESLAILSIEKACYQVKLDISSRRVLFILSTTKGNIELLEKGDAANEGIHLHQVARKIASHFGHQHQPLVISNACISGVMSILVAKRMIQSGQYDHAVVIGADVLTRFVLSGFQSLSAISADACKPFDKNRKGVTLGEAAATVILSALPASIDGKPKVKILGGSVSNDANHISGPSRTGEELAMAVTQALEEAEMPAAKIDFISAHGTATIYNDEMEAKAFNLAGLGNTPLNSLKGYFGHTLGAAGVVETIISMHALLHDELIPTFGFEHLGVSQPLNVVQNFRHQPLSTCLKTASGFGGCNAAIVFQKNK